MTTRICGRWRTGWRRGCIELVSFLTDVLGVRDTGAAPFDGTVTYHDSCSGLRELGIKQQPRDLLKAAGVKVVEMTEPEICCGFGGHVLREISGDLGADGFGQDEGYRGDRGRRRCWPAIWVAC